MAEAEWLAGEDPEALLRQVVGSASERKLRLYTVALYTHDAAPDSDRECRARMEVALRFADGGVPLRVLRWHWGGEAGTWPERASQWAEAATRGEVSEGPHRRPVLAGLLHDIFGNPFRPVASDPRWRTETVVALAAGIYADRAFDRLPILADALEEAGCDHADILTHCRGDGPHVRGCWVVDLVLGKS